MSCCFNEEDILPFYLDYYTNFIKADKIIIYDGGSTDNTPNIVRKYPNVEFIVEDKGNMDERNLRDIRNNGWKKYRNDYDWVIVCDMDEFIYHPNINELLTSYENENITVAKINGYDMVAENFPEFKEGKFLPSFIKKGIHEPIWLNKSAVFNPQKVDINYDFGTHSCSPTGEVKYSQNPDIKLLQYKWLSHEYITQKSLKASQRLSDWNLETGMASHYKEYAKMNQDTFMNKLNSSTEIITDFPDKKKIYLFSHNYLINNWRIILENQLNLIKSNGLYDEMTNMYLLAYGENHWKELIKLIRIYDVDDKIITLSIDENFYEYPTLQKLYKFANIEQDSYIFYFHLKGVWSSTDTTRNKNAIESWRKCLEYFNIEKWQNCIEKLKDGYEVAGALYNYNEKEPLFSGNFWWTTSDYVKKLKYPKYDESKNPYLGTPEDDGTWCRVECEKWINTIPNKFYNFYIPKDYGFYYIPIDEKDYRDEKYKISVIIPTYNRLNSLTDCIRSVIKQNYENLEILICHDGPSDIFNSFKFDDNRIRYFNTDTRTNNYGASQRNLLLKKVTGDYVIFLDDDNILYDNYINKMISSVDDKTGMVVCHIHFNDKDWTNLILPRKNQLIACEIDSLNILIKSSIVKSIEWDSIDIGHDHRYINSCEKLIKEQGLQINYIPDVLANHRYLGEKNIRPIVVFNHNYLIGDWENIVKEQLTLLKSSGLYDKCTNIYSYVTLTSVSVGITLKMYEEIINEFDYLHKFQITENEKNNYEFGCLQAISKFSEGNPSDICYYHTKGVFSETIPENTGVKSWRDYLNYFTITKWEDSVEQLKVYDVVGVNYDFNDIHNDYVIGGNFFWTKSEYIKTLPYPETDPNRFNAEKWILGNKDRKVYELFNTGKLGYKNLYMEHIPESKYKENINMIDEIWNTCNHKYNIQQKEYEWKGFINLILNFNIKRVNVLEIGSYTLGTTHGLCQLFNNVISIDIEKRQNWDEFEEEHSNWKYFISDSSFPDMINTIRQLNIKFDLIFIDGDHTYSGVKKDYLNYKEFLNVDGIISFHDVLNTKFHRDLNCFVHDFWNEIKQEYEYIEIINDRNEDKDDRNFMKEIPNSDWGGIGVLIKPNRINELLREYRLPHLIDDYGGVNRLHGLKDLITENLNKNSVVCEIGSFVGKSSELFAIYCKEIHCVDPWIMYHQIDEHMLSAESEFDRMTLNYKNIKKVKMFSVEASKTFNNETFDCIYIDAIHDYEDVKTDILSWVDKVKDGGTISGHDYHMTNDVKKAVDEIFQGCNIKVYSDYSWLVNIDDYRKKENKKEVVIMSSHPNYKMSEDITQQAIHSFGDKDIILSAHCPVSLELQKSVTHFLYDKNNPLIKHDYYDKSWFNTDKYHSLIKLHYNGNDYQHALAVYINYYNAIIYAKSLGYTTAICTNFDIVFSNEDLEIIDSKIKNIYQSGKKSFFMTSNANEGIHYKTIFFITDVDFFLENFKYVTNETDYNTLTREVGSETNCLENFFYQTLKNSDKLLLQQINEGELFSTSKVNLFSNIEYFTILPMKIKKNEELIDDNEHFVIWFSSANSIDNRFIGIHVLKNGEDIFSHTGKIDKDYKFYQKIKFEKDCNYDVICNVYYDDVANQKSIIVNNDVFYNKLKDYGEFWEN